MLAEGLALGIDDKADLATDAFSGMVNGMAQDISLGGVNYSNAAGAISGMVGSNVVNNQTINMTIYGAEGQDVNELANIISDKLQFLSDRKAAVYA